MAARLKAGRLKVRGWITAGGAKRAIAKTPSRKS
jgi:hypothetical protein